MTMRSFVPPVMVCLAGIGLATAAASVDEITPPAETPAEQDGNASEVHQQPAQRTSAVFAPPVVQKRPAPELRQTIVPPQLAVRATQSANCNEKPAEIVPGDWFDSTRFDPETAKFVLNRNTCGQVVRNPVELTDATPEFAYFVDIKDDRPAVTSEAGARCNIGLRDELRNLERKAKAANGNKRQELYAKVEALRVKNGGEKAWRRAKRLIPAAKNPDPQNCFYRPHGGLDGPCAVGDPVYAPYAGTVMEVGERKSCGKFVKIALKPSGDYLVEFCHSSRIETGIRPGVEVHKGQTVARCGRTGLPPNQGSHAHMVLLSRIEPDNCPVIGQVDQSKSPYGGWYILDPSCPKYIFRVKPDGYRVASR